MNPKNDAHEEAQALLPWMANGTLGGTERDRVQAHLQTCAVCRTELAGLHTLRAAGSGAGKDTSEADAAESALARLLPQLDAPAPVPMPEPQPQPQPQPQPVLKGWRARLAANDHSWLRTAVALQFGAIAVMAALLARPAAGPDAQTGPYRVLGAGEPVRTGLVVSFDANTPERELRRIVLASGARVVGGPTATGAWLLDTAQPAATVVARLRAEPAVTLAESLGGEGRP